MKNTIFTVAAAVFATSLFGTPVSREYVDMQDGALSEKIAAESNRLDAATSDLAGKIAAESNRLDKAVTELMDEVVAELDGRIAAESNKLETAVAELRDKTEQNNQNQRYIYDDGNRPPTNLLDAAGMLYGLALEDGREKGGVWQVSVVSNQVATTYFARFTGQDDETFRWSTNGVFDVELRSANGLITVTSHFSP